jgi:hypothetical protein
MKVIAFGTGRSATLSTWQLFQRLGLRAVHQPNIPVGGHRPDLARAREIITDWGRDYDAVSSGGNLPWLLGIIRDVYPQCKLVWLLRSVVQTVRSMVGPMPTFGDLPQWNKALGIHPKATTRFEQAVSFWVACNAMAETEFAKIPARLWRVVRVDDYAAEVPLLCRWLGYDPIPAPWENQLQELGIPQWSDEQWEHIMEHAGPHMNRWFPDWRERYGLI